ncbi:MAG: outer membrane lipoprotein chaperone LolA [Pseudomonadota bacterium]
MTARLFARILVPLLALGVFAGVAHAGARESLDAFTRGLKGLDGRFSQEVFDSKGKRKESASGRVALSAPRLFRWEYVKPYPQLIVADGAKVWVYDPDLKQATVRPQGVEEQNSPLAALIDPKKLDRDFIVREAGSEGGLDWLELLPKQTENAAFQHARLGFDAKGLVRMRIVDSLGQRTEIAFTGWKRNPAFAPQTFRFAPPKGVDVVGE